MLVDDIRLEDRDEQWELSAVAAVPATTQSCYADAMPGDIDWS